MTDADGELLGAILSEDESWRFPPMGPVPGKFEKALVAFEDKRYYRHAGVDPLALARALWLDVSRGEVVSGGSTITMQVARLGLGPGRRGLWRKGREMLIAARLEMRYTKQEILRLFASNAPFGGNVVGLEAASWRYFGRPPDALSWAEAATLAVLPNTPSLVHVGRNRATLREKRDRLLDILRDEGTIDTVTHSLALSEDLPPEPFPIPRLAPHLVWSIRAGTFGDAAGSLARTTLRSRLQVGVSDIVRRRLLDLSANGIHNAAVLVVSNTTGAVLAYVGNHPDLGAVEGGHVDIIRQPRSTGSLLKPFLYAGMLDDGMLLPEQLVPDIPTRFPGFAPENSTKTFRGAVPAYMALARSLNVPAVRLLRSYGLDRFAGDLQAIGMSTLFRPAREYGLTLILGGAEGTLWDLTTMYAGLARSAAGVERPFFDSTIWADGGNRADGIEQYTTGASYLTLEALLRVLRPGAGIDWEEYASSERIAWKTGTSQGYRDAWAIGVTRDYTVGVWVGNADGEPRPILWGTVAAAPILFAVFDMLPDTRWFDRPEPFLTQVEVCALSGFPPGPDCERTVLVDSPRGAHLGEPCPYCRTVHLDPTGSYRTNAVVEHGGPMVHRSWFVLPPAMEWYYRQGNADYRALPPYKAGAEEETEAPMSLLYPHAGSQVFLPRELDGERGKLVAQAVHSDPAARIYWHLDDWYLGGTEGLHTLSIDAAPGEHVLTLVDTAGARVELPFTVLAPE